MAKALFIEGRRNGYSPDQCGRTMTVEELIGWLEQFDYDSPVYLTNDRGYTFGNITETSFSDDEEYESESDYR